jgi:REP-associated tyrosine transposase
MTLPRSQLVNTNFTPYYHCVSRCVRRAFLCGRDALTGFNFDHRRDWIEARLMELTALFAIDLCAYAVMSNHYHVVLHINTAQLVAWTDADVVARWQQLHRLPDGFENFDEDLASRVIAVWRERLGSISWFMKCLNEPLARLANREDGCKGRFWEGRFKSQALLDEASLLKCMAYVDLNPVRAGVARTPEDSAHTSVRTRIELRDKMLAPMNDQCAAGFVLPIRKQEYLNLVDWTGRQYREDKRGRINEALPPIVQRLQCSCLRSWAEEMRHLTRHYCRAIGTRAALSVYRDQLGQHRLNGLAT